MSNITTLLMDISITIEGLASRTLIANLIRNWLSALIFVKYFVNDKYKQKHYSCKICKKTVLFSIAIINICFFLNSFKGSPNNQFSKNQNIHKYLITFRNKFVWRYLMDILLFYIIKLVHIIMNEEIVLYFVQILSI